MTKNIILMADSYKYSQWAQYPDGTEYVYSYIEARGGVWDKTLFVGLQGFIKDYLVKPVTMEDIDEAESYIIPHGLPFYREGWEYIVREHGGKLPVEIHAVPEGTLVPLRNVLVTVQNTDPNCWWLTSFLETAILRAVWYPTTVATNSYTSKQIILKYLELTGDPSLISFKLHDFGDRGVSSEESAAIGGFGHLVNFMGTDTVPALRWARKNYNSQMAGFSIPAMEHSTVTSWGREGEEASFRNMLNLYAKPGALVACVSDSYDVYAACEMWGTKLKEQVVNSGATVVIRPDSGEPSEVVLKCLEILAKHFGYTTNSKGFKVLNNVRIIQGDGIDHSTINSILAVMYMNGYSADNVAFGQGGALLQAVTRDTMMFAMKCSAICVNGQWRDVYKDPVTDSGKRSKRGLVTLFHTKERGFYSGVQDWMKSALEPVFVNGVLLRDQTLDEIREIASKG